MNNLNPLMMFPFNQTEGFPFRYVINFTGVAASATATGSTDIDAGYIFKWQTLSYAAFVAGVQIDIAEILAQINDPRSGRNFFDLPTPLDLIAGRGDAFSDEFVLPVPHLFDPSSTITSTITSYATGGSTLALQLIFGGIKIATR